MSRVNIVKIAPLILGLLLGAGNAVAQPKAQPTSDVEGVKGASHAFIAAISARDIDAIDKAWAHEPSATFTGPLSTTLWLVRSASGRLGRCASASLTE
jgi:hypothetical protein